jgi:hypothetical protein
MGRLFQVLLVATTLAVSWLAMMIVHELGHVIAAWASGEKITKVVLHPLAISRTDTTHDHHPQLVVWGGPIGGVAIPLALLAIALVACRRLRYLFQFFAGFCLVANGVYIGLGWPWLVGDAGDLLRFGASRVALVLFGLLTVPAGFYLWNGLAPSFGLGGARTQVDRRATVAMLLLLVTIVGLEVLFA